ncbi:MAG: stage II sporulation protein M [Planctomycetota bacterium]
MKTAELVAGHAPQWRQLEQLCTQLESRGTRIKLGAHRRTEFAALYRSACADLALADAYQLPAETTRYLHNLVGRAHNLLYRVENAHASDWWEELMQRVPRRLYRDNYLRLAAALFWGGFLASALLASRYGAMPNYAETVLGQDQIQQLEQMYAEPTNQGRGLNDNVGMSGFYLWHNTTIGLRCFVMGVLLGIGGMFETLFNAVFLGAAFGHMSTTPESDNFFTFVTAHGPFELTAIVMSAAAGMRLGFSIVDTGGLRRADSLMLAGRQALPTMFAAVFLFLFAAFIEGFISPSALPYSLKSMVAVLSTLALLGYLIVLGQAGDADGIDDEQLTIEG